MNIRKEKDSDKEKIWKVNAEAFESEAEANLVNAYLASQKIVANFARPNCIIDSSRLLYIL